MKTPDVPPIALLGVCERAIQVADVHPSVLKWNVLGLTSIVFANVFPMSLRGWNLAVAIHTDHTHDAFEVVVRCEDGTEQGAFTIALKAVDGEMREPLERGERGLLLMPGSWIAGFYPLDGPGLFIPRPGQYSFLVRTAETEVPIGALQFVVVDPAPLTPDRIAAIKSDPNAAKAVRAELACGKCASKQRVYAGLERFPSMEEKGYVWYSELPEQFVCACGATTLDLTITRRNFFALVGRPISKSDNVSFFPLYEKSTFDKLASDLRTRLDTSGREEELQVFFNDHPILLHEFSPARIFPKTPVLTRYNTDFAILNARRELILVELEKASTRLLKADGGVAAELQHAFDQVHSWLQVFDDHRGAALECLPSRHRK